MMHPDAYLTINAVSTGDWRDRGSKFIAVLCPCSNDSQLQGLIDAQRKNHPNARHVVFGAILGSISPEERCSDDGEPSGTAGLPVLNQLRSAELRNTALLVVRYFGGTKLGKAGLINAYKESARLAIEEAAITRQFNVQRLSVVFSYDRTGEVTRQLDQLANATIIDHVFEQVPSIHFTVPLSEVGKALHLFDYTDEITVTVLDV